MAYRNPGRAAFRVRKNYGTVCGVKIPKFDVALGTDDEKEAFLMEQMLDTLASNHTLGIRAAILLRDVATRQKKAAEIYHQVWAGQKLHQVKAILSREPLQEAWESFLLTGSKRNGLPIGERTKDDYRKALNRLLEVNPDATVPDLADVLSVYRKQCVEEGTHTTFNHVRAACLSFARNHEPEKELSTLWREVKKVAPCPGSKGLTDIAMRVYEVRAIIDKLPTQAMKDVAYCMMLTGMGALEYSGDWEVKEDRVVIHGTKTSHRVREVPLLANLTPHKLHYYYAGKTLKQPKRSGEVVQYIPFAQAVRKASEGKAGPALFRHSFRLWLRLAGVDEWRADRYFGHATNSLKRRYAGHEWSAFIREDTKRMLEYLRSEWEEPKTEEIQIERLKLG